MLLAVEVSGPVFGILVTISIAAVFGVLFWWSSQFK